MKKILILAGLAVMAFARSHAATALSESSMEVAAPAFNPPAQFVYVLGGKIAVDNTGTSPVPVYLTSTANSAESSGVTFWQGVGVGFAWGGIAWIFRLVRQTAKQNPEI